MTGKIRFSGALIILAICLTLMTWAAPGSSPAADKVIKWKMQTHWPASSSSYADSAQVLVKKLKERTGGQLDIELFPADALVPSKELFNAAKRGMIQIVGHLFGLSPRPGAPDGCGLRSAHEFQDRLGVRLLS